MTDKQEEIRKKLEELGIKLTPEDMEKALVKFRELGKGNIDRTIKGEAMTDRLSKEEAVVVKILEHIDVVDGKLQANATLMKRAAADYRKAIEAEHIEKVEAELCDLIKNMKFTDAKYVVLMSAKANKILSILKGES